MRMYIIIVAMLLGLLCHARIGETFAQCEARYGKPVREVLMSKEFKELHDASYKMYIYKKGNYKIQITFLHGICHVIEISRHLKNNLTSQTFTSAERTTFEKMYGPLINKRYIYSNAEPERRKTEYWAITKDGKIEIKTRYFNFYARTTTINAYFLKMKPILAAADKRWAAERQRVISEYRDRKEQEIDALKREKQLAKEKATDEKNKDMLKSL